MTNLSYQSSINLFFETISFFTLIGDIPTEKNIYSPHEKNL